MVWQYVAQRTSGSALAAAEIATIVQVFIGTCEKEMSAFIDKFFSFMN